MAHRRIAIGETSSFRYIGVEPPLEDIDAGRIVKVLKLPKWMIWGMDYDIEAVPGNPPYTEFRAEVGQALDIIGRDVVDHATVELAHAIGRLIEEKGDTVEILEGMVPTDFEHPIFGEEADELRALQAEMRIRQQNQGS